MTTTGNECDAQARRSIHKHNARCKRKDRVRTFITQYKLGHPCLGCGETDPAELTFHHRIPNEKEFCLSNAPAYSWTRIRRELGKCDVLCDTCHQKMNDHFDGRARRRDREFRDISRKKKGKQ